MQYPDAGRVRRILLYQVIATVILSLPALGVDKAMALSALIGGGAATLANALFAFGVFGRYQAQEPGRLAVRMYAAEILKLVLTIGLFAAAFILVKPLSLVALLGAYLAVHLLPAALTFWRDAG